MSPSAKHALIERRFRERGLRPSFAAPVILSVSAGVFAFMGLIAMFTLPFAGGIMAAAKASQALDSIQAQPHAATFQTTRMYDRNGTLLYEFVDPRAGRRTVIHLNEVPEAVLDATIAVEDKNFYTNPGFDLQGLVRAAYDDLTNKKIVEGGSSITQQLVKQVYLSPEVSFDRKIREIILAFTLTRTLTKDQILEAYLNQIYYGNQAYGIEAAAEAYFGKKVQDLDLAESAMLAGLPQSPSQYDPITNLRAAKARQLDVLNLMVDQGYITPNQAAGARDEPLKFVDRGIDIKAPHWVFYVRDYLEQKYGPNFVYGTGLNIKTTLDLDLNNKAQQIIQDDLDKIPAGKNVNDAALVAVDPTTGQILAMVGSRDYNQVFPNGTMDGRFNAATAPLQPGSSFKPFAYVTDFMIKNRTPVTMVADTPLGHTFPDGPGIWFDPKNYDGKFHGWLSLRYALANSLNIPAVKVLSDAGVDNTLNTAHDMGITTLNDRASYGLGLALVLGAGEVLPVDMASAYGVFATGGDRYPLNPILSITDGNGKVVEEYKRPAPQHVLKPEYAYLITSILSDDHAREMEFGPHSALWLPDRPVAVKTGTTDQFRANWTIGYTPSLSVAVWAGNSNHTPMNNVIGIDGAGPIWHDFMEYALRDTPAEPFEAPSNIVDQCIPGGGNVGMPPSGSQRCWHDVFVKGTERSAMYQSITVGNSAYVRPLPPSSPSASPSPSPAEPGADASAPPADAGSPAVSPAAGSSPASSSAGAPSPTGASSPAPAPPSPQPAPPSPVAAAPAPAAPAPAAAKPSPPGKATDKVKPKE
ncbi:MAG TPA: PBP1A family penicillin-binding protein [Chloroflexota bacterium]|nr:PBP1A family penicillin-binding protein [Chloroflexota bacterium]